MMSASNLHYELADRTRATARGGIGAIHRLVRKLGLDQAISHGRRLTAGTPPTEGATTPLALRKRCAPVSIRPSTRKTCLLDGQETSIGAWSKQKNRKCGTRTVRATSPLPRSTTGCGPRASEGDRGVVKNLIFDGFSVV